MRDMLLLDSKGVKLKSPDVTSGLGNSLKLELLEVSGFNNYQLGSGRIDLTSIKSVDGKLIEIWF